MEIILVAALFCFCFGNSFEQTFNNVPFDGGFNAVIFGGSSGLIQQIELKCPAGKIFNQGKCEDEPEPCSDDDCF